MEGLAGRKAANTGDFGEVNKLFDKGLTGMDVSHRMRALRSPLFIFSFRKCHENIFRQVPRSPARLDPR